MKHRLSELTEQQKQDIKAELHNMAKRLDEIETEVGDVSVYAKIHSFGDYAAQLRHLAQRVMGEHWTRSV